MYLLLRAEVIAFLGFLLQSWLSKILTTPQRFCFVPIYSVPLDCPSLMSFITSLSPPPLCRFPIVRTLVSSCTWNCLLRHLRLQANWKEVVSVGVSPSLSQPVLAFLWQFGRWTNFPVFGSTPGLLMHPSHPSTPPPQHTHEEKVVWLNLPQSSSHLSLTSAWLSCCSLVGILVLHEKELFSRLDFSKVAT